MAFVSGAVARGALLLICSCNLLLITDIDFFIQQGARDKPVIARGPAKTVANKLLANLQVDGLL
jgi:hypothetical protein